MNTFRGITRLLAVSVITTCLSSPAVGEEAGHADHEEARNVIGPFIGITGEGRRENGLALGIEGAHFFTENFGIAGVLEYTAGDIEALVGVVPLVFRTGPWRAYAGPGFENGDAAEDNEFLVRIGAEYSIEAGDIEIGPQLNFDIVDGDVVVVIGVFFGNPF